MKIFILEDDPGRIRWFARRFDAAGIRDDDWTCIQTAARFYDYHPPYDVVFLDHDLGGRQLVDHPDNGLAFVQDVITTFGGFGMADVIIHSHNDAGAHAMAAIVDASRDDHPAMVIPFGCPSFRVLVDSMLPRPKWVR